MFPKDRIIKSLILIVALLVILILSCSENAQHPIGPDKSNQKDVIVPLEVGNYWIYRRIIYAFSIDSSWVTDTIKVAITSQIEYDLNGTVYDAFVTTSYDNTGNPDPDTAVVYLDSMGYWELGVPDTGGPYPYPLTKVLMVKYPVEMGESWEYNHYYDGVCDSVGVEIVTPLGRYKCYQISFRKKETCPFDNNSEDDLFPDNGTHGSFYVPNIGRVTLARQLLNNDILRWELISYFVK